MDFDLPPIFILIYESDQEAVTTLSPKFVILGREGLRLEGFNSVKPKSMLAPPPLSGGGVILLFLGAYKIIPWKEYKNFVILLSRAVGQL